MTDDVVTDCGSRCTVTVTRALYYPLSAESRRRRLYPPRAVVGAVQIGHGF